MRALCGAIISAGAMIGLGLTAIGIGIRYEHQVYNAQNNGEPVLVHLSQMDRPLTFVLVFLTCATVVGMGIAFLGLAYHHHRRERDHRFARERAAHRATPTPTTILTH